MLRRNVKRNSETQEVTISEILNIDALDTSSSELEAKIEQSQFEDRELYLTGEITQQLVQDLITKIRYLNKVSAEPITLYINSCGGSVCDGFALCDVILSSQSPIMGYVQGSCMSMAVAVLASCVDRVAGRYAQFMVHSVRAEFGEMDQTDMICQANYINRLNEQVAYLLADASNLKSHEWLDKIIYNETYFTSEDALEFGLIDEIM